MFKMVVFFNLIICANAVFSAQYSIYGKVKMVRLHQYLSGKGWDENIWFCLDSKEVKGSCGTTSACNGGMGLAIDKKAQPELYSTILAARISQTPIKVWVIDDFKMRDSSFCYARIVDL